MKLEKKLWWNFIYFILTKTDWALLSPWNYHDEYPNTNSGKADGPQIKIADFSFVACKDAMLSPGKTHGGYGYGRQRTSTQPQIVHEGNITAYSLKKYYEQYRNLIIWNSPNTRELPSVQAKGAYDSTSLLLHSLIYRAITYQACHSAFG